MRRNKKIIISLIFILILNIFLVGFGYYKSHLNTNDDKGDFYDDFTSRLFVDYATNGYTKDYEVMMEMFDSSYVDSKGKEVRGISMDEEYFDSGSTFRNSFSDNMLSRSISWPELVWLGQSMSNDLTANESKKLIKTVIALEHGATFGAYMSLFDFTLADIAFDPIAEDKAINAAILCLALPYGLGDLSLDPYGIAWWLIDIIMFTYNSGILESELITSPTEPQPGEPDYVKNVWDDIYSVIMDVEDVPNIIFNPLSPTTKRDAVTWIIGYALDMYMGMKGFNFDGIDLFVFDNTFTYTENIGGVEVEATYDFSSKLTKELIEGDDTHLGINNWDTDEVHAWFTTLGLTTDFTNNGNIHQSMLISNGFRYDSNSYYAFSNFLHDNLVKYKGIEYEWYSIERINTKPSDEDARGTKPPLLRNWVLNPVKTNVIDTEGEALLYSIYENIDYHEYFDRALEIDGLESYSYKYISELYGNSRYLAEDFIPYTWEKVRDESSENRKEEPVAYDDIIYKKGQKEDIEFEQFMILSYTYKPFLRSANYEQLVWDIAGLVYK